MKAIAKITFEDVKDLCFIKSRAFNGNKCLIPTIGVEPNDWTVQIIFLENLQPNNTAIAEIKMFPEADYLFVVGNVLQLFGGTNPPKFKWHCEILEVIKDKNEEKTYNKKCQESF